MDNYLENKEYNYKSIYASNCIEFWKPVTNYSVPNVEENRYLISSFGKIKDLYTGKIFDGHYDGWKKYKMFSFSTYDTQTNKRDQTHRNVHRVEMLEFEPIPEKYTDQLQVNHMDGNTTNNKMSNFEWVLCKENREHSINNALEDTIFGRPIVKLTKDDVHNIYVLRELEHKTYPAIINELNLLEKGAHNNLLSRIALGKSKLYSKYYN